MKVVAPEIAEICGAVIGDGWIESTESALYIVGNITEDKDYFDKHLGPIFSKTFIRVNPRLYPYWSVYGIHTYAQNIIKDIIKLGIQKGNKANYAKIPKWIFSSKKLMAAVLRGLFDTDGSFYCKKCYGKYDNEFRKKYHCQPTIQIKSTSKELIVQIFKIMERLDLHPEKIKIRKGGFLYNKNCKESYFVKLNKLDEIRKWFEILKLSSNPKHITKYLIWKKFGFCPPYTTLVDRKRILEGNIDLSSYY